jgi:hypothetical protein
MGSHHVVLLAKWKSNTVQDTAKSYLKLYIPHWKHVPEMGLNYNHNIHTNII